MNRPVRTSPLFWCAFAALCLGALPVQAQTVFSVSPDDAELRTVDPTTGATLSMVTMTLGGNPIAGANGVAQHPVTGQIWVVTGGGRGSTSRQLATVDPTTGVLTAVGNPGVALAGLAFDCAGNLYGISGDGANPAEAAFVLSQSTGAATLLTRLSRGDDGEVIAFNPITGRLFHGSGIGQDFDFQTNDGVILEHFDPSRPPFAGIPIPGGSPLFGNEVQALTFDPSSGNFLWKGGNFAPGPFFSVTPAGVATMLGNLDHQSKGLAFSGGMLFSVSSRDDQLRVINPATGATLSMTTITLAGSTVSGANALAAHPSTGQLFAILRATGFTRALVTINPSTGVATLVGDTGDCVNSMAFDAAGNLFATTGFDCNIRSGFLRISTTTAALTYLYSVERNNVGFAMAFNPNDGFLYLATGTDMSDMVFETIDVPAIPVDVNIMGTALTNSEPLALTFDGTTGDFLWADLGADLYRVTTGGVPTFIGTLDHTSKGLVVQNATGCSADVGITKADTPDPITLGSGNITYTITVTNAGPAFAAAATMSDPLPASANFASLTAPSGWVCTTPAVGANGTVNCSHPGLAVGAMDVFQLAVTPTAAGTLSNTVMAVSAVTDSATANNMDTEDTTVNPAANTNTDFSLGSPTGTTQVITVRPGETGSFTFVVDPIPAGSMFGADVTLTCVVDPFVGTCTVVPSTIPAGSGTTTVTVTITPTIFGALPPTGGLPFVPWLALASLALIASAFGLKRSHLLQPRYATALALAGVLVSLALFQSACAGSRGQKYQGPYQVTVTATSAGISHSTTAVYNVSKP